MSGVTFLLYVLAVMVGAAIGWIVRATVPEAMPDAIEFDTQADFIKWQKATMMRAFVANNLLCETAPEFGGLEFFDTQAEAIRETAREGAFFWTHDVDARATDATIAWCARWLGLLQPIKKAPIEPSPADFELVNRVDGAADATASSYHLTGNPSPFHSRPRVALDLDAAFDTFTKGADFKHNADAERNVRATEWVGKLQPKDGK